MLVFHEGLPRSGKSYEALVEHIIPAVKKGRMVYALVDGLNYEQIADIAGRPLESVRELLIQLDDKWIPKLPDCVTKDSLVVIDEVQDYWPSSRQKMPESITRWIARHGHDGLDLVLMGQSIRDVNVFIRRRTQRLISFTKMTGVGMPKSYKWEAYEATTAGKFHKINSGIKKYDEKYFGTYKSHSVGTENKEVYLDDRTNIFKTSAFRVFLPVFFFVLVFAVYYLFSFLTDPQKIAHASEEAPVQISAEGVRDDETKLSRQEITEADLIRREQRRLDLEVEQRRYEFEKQKKEQREAEKEQRRQQKLSNDPFWPVAQMGRLRLSALLQKPDGSYTGYVDILDGSYRKKDRWSISDLQATGWTIELKEYGLEMRQYDEVLLARPWPVDPWGQVSKEDRVQERLRDDQ
jgi:hypothetical protein